MNQETEWLLTEKYHRIESPAFHDDCVRLSRGEPLGFVIGWVPFLDCTIHLDSNPLIPRPETEYWVEKAITVMSVNPRNDPGLIRVLDLCAGSGAIGVAIAKAVPCSHVTFGELDDTHLPTIFKNLARNGISCTRYKAFASDLFENISGTFEYIFCNPPYIDSAANTVEQSVTDFEPHLALFGGTKGLELIERIITDAPSYLTPTGQLWLEHEPAQVEALARLAAKHRFTIVTHPDQYDTPRFSVLTMAQ